MIPTIDIMLSRLVCHEHCEYALKIDQHYKGIFALVADLPATGVDGDYAIVKETGTFWYWDANLPGWVNTYIPEPQVPVVINDGETKTILTADASVYRTIEYLVSVNDDNTGAYFSAKLLAHHDGTEADHTQFAMIGKKTVRLFAEYAGGNIELKGTGLKDGQIVTAISRKVNV